MLNNSSISEQQINAMLRFMRETDKSMKAGENQGWMTADDVRTQLENRRQMSAPQKPV